MIVIIFFFLYIKTVANKSYMHIGRRVGGSGGVMEFSRRQLVSAGKSRDIIVQYFRSFVNRTKKKKKRFDCYSGSDDEIRLPVSKEGRKNALRSRQQVTSVRTLFSASMNALRVYDVPLDAIRLF